MAAEEAKIAGGECAAAKSPWQVKKSFKYISQKDRDKKSGRKARMLEALRCWQFWLCWLWSVKEDAGRAHHNKAKRATAETKLRTTLDQAAR